MSVSIEDAKRVEEEGRRRAFQRDEIPRSDWDFLIKLDETSRRISEWFKNLGLRKESEFAESISASAMYAKYGIRNCESEGRARKNCEIDPEHIYFRRAMRHLEDADLYSEKLFGKRCTWLAPSFDAWKEKKQPYNASSMLNDLTSCYHRTLEKYSETVGKWKTEGKCVWRVK